MEVSDVSLHRFDEAGGSHGLLAPGIELFGD